MPISPQKLQGKYGILGALKHFRRFYHLWVTYIDMDEELHSLSAKEIADKIKRMEIRGAAFIARATAIAVKNAALSFKSDDPQEFKDYMADICNMLVSTRPTAVSLPNALYYVMHNVDHSDVDEAKIKIKERSDKFVKNSLIASKKIAEYGGKRLKDGDVIITHCNSSLAIGAIFYAYDQGKDIQVIATESRPKRQGYITVRELAEHGVDVSLIVDSAVRYFMNEADHVYIGADSVASNGAVINKIGTSQVALCAHEARVPVTVCAETYKFSRETMYGDLIPIEEREAQEIVEPDEFPGVTIRNPVFDATPEKYIDAIITEKGIISPSGAYRIIKELEI